MPQDGSNNYQYPPGTPGIPDQTIQSESYNTFLDDLVNNDLNIPRPITRGGTGASDSTQALVNLGGEKSSQVVTNYDTQVFLSGSFYSAVGATNAPVAGHAFVGIAYSSDPPATPPANSNIVIEAYDQNDISVPGKKYLREKKAGVWGLWKIETALVVGQTPPAGAADNALFWDSDNGILYINYNDGNSTQWVQAVALPAVDTTVFVQRGGDTMTGLLTLSGDPSAVMHAATKQYVDGGVGGVSGGLTSKIGKAGGADGIMTGFLTLSADPDAAMKAATKQYVDRSNITSPQGRLTLATGTPVMTTTQPAKTTIYYTPYVGNRVSVWDGSTMSMMTFAELSVATTDAIKNPSPIGASKVNDWFVWNDAGTLRLSHGPDWTNDTTRATGLTTTPQNVLVNTAAITNGPAAFLGTYVGTTRSNTSSQLDWIYGVSNTTPTAGFFGVWNAYSRVNVATSFSDTTVAWTYNSATIRAANGQATMRATFVRGLNEDPVKAQYSALCGNTAGGGNITMLGVGLDTTTAYSGTASGVQNLGNYFRATGIGCWAGLAGIGVHFVSANEHASVTGAEYIGFSNSTQQSGLTVELRA